MLQSNSLAFSGDKGLLRFLACVAACVAIL